MARTRRSTAIVTGAGSPGGIASPTARRLGRAGMSVAIVATSERIHERAAELREVGVDAVGFVADLRDEHAGHASWTA